MDEAKPDLVAVRDGCVHVVEVTVPYDGGRNYLDKCYSEKLAKYVTAETEVKRRFGTESVVNYALVVGARGGWCAGNDVTCSSLPLSQKTQANMRRTALIETVKMLDRAMSQAQAIAPR